ncbi:high mobility group protein D-like [Helicoverpa zea]|uniref:high mobility group protein D-like n=1 Tax=Helicoverpa zea TaxID=7113 RepID=UPI001F5AD0CD|nr:high mobility group protein D-like [Helicoverpa zea]XP_047031998.1 high mobility group protein D-like [Helicoverpa zea]XP_047031999.1 high mobility group protein D-like [Helicoverpa zea]XP_047032000.1 high mobility group protein D-like [Helicoverpa zea]
MMEKPKRPMSAYLLWLNSERGKIKADHPGLKVTEVAKKAGEIWRSMDDKSTWEEKAAEAKEQYAKDLECYNANGGAPTPKKAQKRGGAKAKPAKASRTKHKKEQSEDEDASADEDDAGDSE